MERLQKIIARAGVASRRNAERLIREGRVSVGGKVVSELGFLADAGKDKIRVDGRSISLSSKRLYYMFHKPMSLITSMADPQGRPSLGERLAPLMKEGRLFPVGRLDYHSSGLLLLTNHGELAYRLSHPSYEVKKVYEVKVGGLLSEDELDRLRVGVRVGGRMTAPARVKILSRLKKKSWLEIEIHEGRYREVRRMLEVLGYAAEKLMRRRFGPLQLGPLSPGKWRPLIQKEVASLYRAVGMRADVTVPSPRGKRVSPEIPRRFRPGY